MFLLLTCYNNPFESNNTTLIVNTTITNWTSNTTTTDSSACLAPFVWLLRFFFLSICLSVSLPNLSLLSFCLAADFDYWYSVLIYFLYHSLLRCFLFTFVFLLLCQLHLFLCLLNLFPSSLSSSLIYFLSLLAFLLFCRLRLLICLLYLFLRSLSLSIPIFHFIFLLLCQLSADFAHGFVFLTDFLVHFLHLFQSFTLASYFSASFAYCFVFLTYFLAHFLLHLFIISLWLSSSLPTLVTPLSSIFISSLTLFFTFILAFCLTANFAYWSIFLKYFFHFFPHYLLYLFFHCGFLFLCLHPQHCFFLAWSQDKHAFDW